MALEVIKVLALLGDLFLQLGQPIGLVSKLDHAPF